MKKTFVLIAVLGLFMGCQKTDNTATAPATYAPVPTEEPRLNEVGVGGGASSGTREADVLPLNR